MPKVKQYDWDKLKPTSVDKNKHQGTKNFSTYEYTEPRKGSKNGAVKTTRPPRWKPQDKSLGREWYDQNSHLTSIMKED